MHNDLRHIKILPSGGFTGVEKYLRTTCKNVRKLDVVGVDGRKVQIYAPCGCCDVCRYQSQQSWITRMAAHCVSFPNVYFITLTVSSEALAVSADLRKEFCAIEYNGKYLPLLLSKKVYQNFLKRLRKSRSDCRLSYFFCGELGEKNSRPHYHAILWSDKPLTREDVVGAWSLESLDIDYTVEGRKYHNCIGDVRFDDLYNNGTLEDIFHNPNISKDSVNDKFKSSYAFKYVSKYVNKTYKKQPKTYELIKNYVLQNKEYFVKRCAFKSFLEDESEFVGKVCNRLCYFTQVSLRNSIGGEFYDQQLAAQFSLDCKEISIAGQTYVCPTFFRKRFLKNACPIASKTRPVGRSYSFSHFVKCCDVLGVANRLDDYDTYLRTFHDFNDFFTSLAKFRGMYSVYDWANIDFVRETDIIRNLLQERTKDVCFYGETSSSRICKVFHCGLEDFFDEIVNLYRGEQFTKGYVYLLDKQVYNCKYDGVIDVPFLPSFYDCITKTHFQYDETYKDFGIFKYDRGIRDFRFIGSVGFSELLENYSSSLMYMYDYKVKSLNHIEEVFEHLEEFSTRLQSALGKQDLNEYLHIMRENLDSYYWRKQKEYDYKHKYL